MARLVPEQRHVGGSDGLVSLWQPGQGNRIGVSVLVLELYLEPALAFPGDKYRCLHSHAVAELPPLFQALRLAFKSGQANWAPFQSPRVNVRALARCDAQGDPGKPVGRQHHWGLGARHGLPRLLRGPTLVRAAAGPLASRWRWASWLELPGGANEELASRSRLQRFAL